MLRFLLTAAIVCCAWPLAGELRAEDEPMAQAEVANTEPSRPARKPNVTIAKETTFIEKPLSAGGWPDYLAALDHAASQGVTPSNNAAELLVRAFGPSLIDDSRRGDYFRRLGLPSLKMRGDYFVTQEEMVGRWVAGAPKLPDENLEEELPYQFYSAGGTPWTAKQYPIVAEWLAINAGPLSQIIAASERSKFFEPIVTSNPKTPALIAVEQPLAMPLTEAMLALRARAMWHVGSKNVAAAWRDLLAYQRLVRLAENTQFRDYRALFGGEAGDVTEIGSMIRQLLHSGKPDAKLLKQIAADLKSLPPPVDLARRIDTVERYRYLDTVCLLAREGPLGLEQMFGGFAPDAEDDAIQKAVGDNLFDWNEPLRMGNQWCDKLVRIAKLTDRAEREAAFAEAREELDRLASESASPGFFALNWFTKRSARAALSRVVGASLLQMIDIDLDTAVAEEDSRALDRAFTQTALLLASYRAEHKHYPEKLTELVPKFSATLPGDPHLTDSCLGYDRHGNGYSLWSVGPNGVDDQTIFSDDFIDADDVIEVVDDPYVEIPEGTEIR